ncbi:MAG TPA: hypothetical protein VNO52_12370, partial [Methylomirabilota bacterium]|nr:hypothetical protein [Methylomirabilota bacterium]
MNAPQVPKTNPTPQPRCLRLLKVAGPALLPLLGLVIWLHPHPQNISPPWLPEEAGPAPVPAMNAPLAAPQAVATSTASEAGPPVLTAAQLVAGKVSQFARSRHEMVHAMARRFNVAVPAEVDLFFGDAQAGRWDDLKARFQAMRQRLEEEPEPRELRVLWPAILETFGVAEAAHDWPAQKLLDYGEAILGSLRPGMVYVGGTDAGRFIPTLLNETGSGERHIVLTQSALAAQNYLDYLSFLYGDRMVPLTAADSQRAFQEYLHDARQRLEHDQQFPDQQPRLRPGEDVRLVGNSIQVAGQVAVSAINEALLRGLMDKNPGLAFAFEESFPFDSLRADASTLGPILELRAQDSLNPLTAERASETVAYWEATARRLQSQSAKDEENLIGPAYARMAAAQAGLLEHHGYAAEAEKALRLATEIGPASPEAV